MITSMGTTATAAETTATISTATITARPSDELERPSAARISELTDRAARMRRWARNAPAPLAVAYRRRAAELELLLAIVTPEPVATAA